MTVTLTGENSFLLQSELQKRIGSFIDKYTDFALERFSGELDYDKVLSAVQVGPFLTAKRLIVLQDVAAHKKLSENIELLLSLRNPDTELLIVEPKIDKRSVFYKILQKQTELKMFGSIDERSATNWLVTEAKQQGGKLSLADARYFVQRVGLDQQRLHNELQKVLLYSPDITRETLDLLVEPSPQTSVFNLLDAVFVGDVKRALAIYQDQRGQQVEPQAILAMIGWQLHALSLVKTAGSRSVDQIASTTKLNPFVIRKCQGITRNVQLTTLRKLVRLTLDLDVQLKTKSIDSDAAIQNLLITIAEATS